MEKVYSVVHLYDVDGGFGDPIPTETTVGYFMTEEEAKAYVEKYSAPRVYEANLYENELEVREINLLSMDENPFE